MDGKRILSRLLGIELSFFLHDVEEGKWKDETMTRYLHFMYYFILHSFFRQEWHRL